jgi:hypoxanthine phosphoribosyltransferase
MNYINIADLNSLLLKKLSLLPRQFDLIVGINEHGLIPANLLALYLNRPFADLNSFVNGHIYKAGERGSFFESSKYKRVLIIDDCLQTGNTMKQAREKLSKLSQQFSFSYCAVYLQQGKEDEVDYFFSHLKQPLFTQWHLMSAGIRQNVKFNLKTTPVFTELTPYPFLISPSAADAVASFRKTGRPVLDISNFELVTTTDTVWKDLKSGRYMPEVKQFAIQMRNKINRIRKKLSL